MTILNPADNKGRHQSSYYRWAIDISETPNKAARPVRLRKKRIWLAQGATGPGGDTTVTHSDFQVT